MASRSFEARAVLGLYTETSLHCGTDSSSGYVDMPVQRERHSGFPMIPGSTIKGILHDEMEMTDDDRDYFFGADEKIGPGGARTPGKAGAVSFSDAFIAAVPVRSSKYPFVWVTCPLILERIYRVLDLSWPAGTGKIAEGEAWSSTEGSEVLLEELEVKVKDVTACDSLLAQVATLLPAGNAHEYTRKVFTERLYAITDEDFATVIETATEIVTRIRIDEKTGTTSQGNGQMFNEELVPRDTLFACVFRELSGGRSFPIAGIPPVIRLGGHETIGRGVTWVSRTAITKPKAEGGAE